MGSIQKKKTVVGQEEGTGGLLGQLGQDEVPSAGVEGMEGLVLEGRIE